jgi:hypothetical protein
MSLEAALPTINASLAAQIMSITGNWKSKDQLAILAVIGDRHLTSIPRGQDDIVSRFNDENWDGSTVDDFRILIYVALRLTNHFQGRFRSSEVRWSVAPMLRSQGQYQVFCRDTDTTVAAGLTQSDADFIVHAARRILATYPRVPE